MFYSTFSLFDVVHRLLPSLLQSLRPSTYTLRCPLDSDSRGARLHTDVSFCGISHKCGWTSLFSIGGHLHSEIILEASPTHEPQGTPISHYNFPDW